MIKACTNCGGLYTTEPEERYAGQACVCGMRNGIPVTSTAPYLPTTRLNPSPEDERDLAAEWELRYDALLAGVRKLEHGFSCASNASVRQSDEPWPDCNCGLSKLQSGITVQPAASTPDFHCHICGIETAIAPDPPGKAVCPRHCEDHDYEHDKSRAGSFCVHCDEQRPEDWDDD